jgi:hypothetical protein
MPRWPPSSSRSSSASVCSWNSRAAAPALATRERLRFGDCSAEGGCGDLLTPSSVCDARPRSEAAPGDACTGQYCTR